MSQNNDWYGGENNSWSWVDSSGQEQPASFSDGQQGYSPYAYSQGYQPAGYDTSASGFYNPLAAQESQQQSQSYWSGEPGVGQPNASYYGAKPSSGFGVAGDSFDELPLLEELGINFDHIKQKTLSVLNPFRGAEPSVIQDDDLAGPLIFCLLFGGSLLLSGKIHFGYIYGIGLLGCLGMFGLLNSMSLEGISVANTASVLGYCLLPITTLAGLAAFLSLRSWFGLGLSTLCVLWSSLSSSKLFVTALNMQSQQPLVAYPCFLIYAVFALLVVF